MVILVSIYNFCKSHEGNVESHWERLSWTGKDGASGLAGYVSKTFVFVLYCCFLSITQSLTRHTITIPIQILVAALDQVCPCLITDRHILAIPLGRAIHLRHGQLGAKWIDRSTTLFSHQRQLCLTTKNCSQISFGNKF